MNESDLKKDTDRCIYIFTDGAATSAMNQDELKTNQDEPKTISEPTNSQSHPQEMTMKTILAALAVTFAIAAAALPASADYTSPDASRLQQSLNHGY